MRVVSRSWIYDMSVVVEMSGFCVGLLSRVEWLADCAIVCTARR